MTIQNNQRGKFGGMYTKKVPPIILPEHIDCGTLYDL